MLEQGKPNHVDASVLWITGYLIKSQQYLRLQDHEQNCCTPGTRHGALYFHPVLNGFSISTLEVLMENFLCTRGLVIMQGDHVVQQQT